MDNKKKSITRGIIYSFSILLILYGVHVVVIARAMQALSGLVRTVHNHPLVVSNASLQASLDVIKMHRSMKDIVLFEDKARIQPTLAEIDTLEKEAGRQLRIVQDNILGFEGQKIVSEAIGLLESWAPIRAGVIAKVQRGDREAAARTTCTEGAAHVAKLEKKMLELT